MAELEQLRTAFDEQRLDYQNLEKHAALEHTKVQGRIRSIAVRGWGSATRCTARKSFCLSGLVEG